VNFYSNPKTLPLVAAGPLNFTSMHWVTGLMKKAYRSGLTPDDLYDTPWRDSADRNARRFILISYYSVSSAVCHSSSLVTSSMQMSLSMLIRNVA